MSVAWTKWAWKLNYNPNIFKKDTLSEYDPLSNLYEGIFLYMTVQQHQENTARLHLSRNYNIYQQQQHEIKIFIRPHLPPQQSWSLALFTTEWQYPGSLTPDTWAEKFESFERVNSIRVTNEIFDSCNSCKRLGTSLLHELNESKFPFVTLIEFIRSKLSDFSAHVSRVSDWLSQGRIGKVHVPIRENIVPQIISAMKFEGYTWWLTRHRLGCFCTHYSLGGGGRIRPPPPLLSRKRMDVERRTRWHSKDLDETLPNHFRKFKIEVTCQVKVRSKVKIGCFQVADRSDLKRSMFRPKPFHMYSQRPGEGTD